MKIILASNSARRKEILTENNIEFECIPSNVDEKINPDLNILENVMNLASQKCIDVYQNNPTKIVLAADTIVVLNNKIYGKPKDEADAFRMLKTLSGNTHEVITGVAVGKNGNINTSYEISKVTFKNMSNEEILDYIKTKEPMDKAGSYAIQGIGNKFILSYEGEFDNIVGLPMKLVKKML